MRKHRIFEDFLRFVEQIRRKVWVIVTLQAAILAVVAPQPAAAEGSVPHVMELSTELFDKQVNTNESAFLVMLHVNWCGICKRTLPAFSEASKSLREADANRVDGNGRKFSPVTFAHVDCTNDKTLPTRFKSKGYPTILYWPRGADLDSGYQEFRGQRNALGFRLYTDRMSALPAVAPVGSEEKLAKSVKNEPFVSFLHVGPADVELPEYFEKFAQEKRDLHLFFRSETASVLPKGVSLLNQAGEKLEGSTADSNWGGP